MASLYRHQQKRELPAQLEIRSDNIFMIIKIKIKSNIFVVSIFTLIILISFPSITCFSRNLFSIISDLEYLAITSVVLYT